MSGDVDRLQQELEALRDELASARYDVESVRAWQDRELQRREAARAGRETARLRAQARRGLFPGRDPVTGDRVEGGLSWAARPFMPRYDVKWQHARLRLKRKLAWLVIWVVGTGVAATVWGPGSPLSPDLACGPQESAFARKAVAGESVVVRTAKLNGRLLRSLAGKPPDPRVTQAKAREVGRSIAVSVVALRASIRGEADPASVRADTAAYRAGQAAKAQAVAASCAPVCPPGQEPRETFAVGFRPAGADPEAERVTRAAAVAAGAKGRALEVMMRLAWRESTFGTRPVNPRSSARGTWMVLVSAHQDDPEIGRVMDPFANARITRRISKDFTDWSPWTTWPAVRAEMAAGGSVTAVPASSTAPAAAACSPASAPSSWKTGAGVAWGPAGGATYANGRIPVSALARPRSAPRVLLRPDAAAAFDRLNAAYRARFGRDLRVTDSYRDLAGQRSVAARKPGLAAKPGTSNHGWALALDVVVGGYGSTDYLWLRQEAPAFGWDNPEWARGAGAKDEPWHWEFNPTGATA